MTHPLDRIYARPLFIAVGRPLWCLALAVGRRYGRTTPWLLGLRKTRPTCPLRGTGDSAACWRAMSFDRELARGMGGELRVLESQSTSGESFCRLAIRPAGSDWSDLPVADPRWRQ